MRKNVLERGRSQITIWRKRIVFWIPKATNIHTEYVTLIALPMEQWYNTNPAQCGVVHTFTVSPYSQLFH
jgi:hypothetical protein